MLIPINDTWRINSDKYQWIVERQTEYNRKATGEKYKMWEPVTYHPKLNKAAEWIKSQHCRETLDATLSQVLDDAEKLHTVISRAVIGITDDDRKKK